jgi:hypothetical protein
VLISFSVTLSRSSPRYWTDCRGVSPTSQWVCISSRNCTNLQFGDWPTCVRPNSNPRLLRGKHNVLPLHHPADWTGIEKLNMVTYVYFKSYSRHRCTDVSLICRESRLVTCLYTVHCSRIFMLISFCRLISELSSTQALTVWNETESS